METTESPLVKFASLDIGCEYRLVVIAKADSEHAYGIAAQDGEDTVLCIKEINADKDTVLSVIDILNTNKVPYVHFLDVVHDLMNGIRY